MNQSQTPENTTKPKWINEEYPAGTTFTEVASGAEADIYTISYRDEDHQYRFDIVYRSIWEGGVYSIKKNII